MGDIIPRSQPVHLDLFLVVVYMILTRRTFLHRVKTNKTSYLVTGFRQDNLV